MSGYEVQKFITLNSRKITIIKLRKFWNEFQGLSDFIICIISSVLVQNHCFNNLDINSRILSLYIGKSYLMKLH